MKKMILKIFLVLALSFVPAVALNSSASAACAGGTSAKGQVLKGVGQVSDCDSGGVNKTIKAIVDIMSKIVGALAVIMILYSGFRYITSAGDSGKVSAAKNTLIYAIVGLAVAVLAQVIVNVVLTESIKATTTTTINSRMV